MFRIQVNTHGDPADSWAGNAIEHDTRKAAIDAAKDLFRRWTAVAYWRVIDGDENVVADGP